MGHHDLFSTNFLITFCDDVSHFTELLWTVHGVNPDNARLWSWILNRIGGLIWFAYTGKLMDLMGLTDNFVSWLRCRPSNVIKRQGNCQRINAILTETKRMAGILEVSIKRNREGWSFPTSDHKSHWESPSETSKWKSLLMLLYIHWNLRFFYHSSIFYNHWLLTLERLNIPRRLRITSYDIRI